MSQSTIAAVTVTHEPDTEWPERLKAIISICGRCIVVDNSITGDARSRIASAVAATPGAELIANPDNPGIGRALNQGFERLRASGCKWVLAFDQDSLPRPDMAARLLATAHDTANETCGRPIAVVGANWSDAARPEHASKHLVKASMGCYRRLPAIADLPDVICVITSGSLFSLQAWFESGGFQEGLFLDLVDTDYCLRIRRAGWRIAVSSQATLVHHRGSKKAVRFLGRAFYPSFTPPFRLHCLSRNRVVLFFEHGRHEPTWVAYELTYACKLLLDIVFLETDKLSKLRALIGGTVTGFLYKPHFKDTLVFRKKP